MIRCYQPKPDELWFRKSLLADPDTMSYNDAWGGTIPFPEEEWDAWYQYWIGEPEGRRFTGTCSTGKHRLSSAKSLFTSMRKEILQSAT